VSTLPPIQRLSLEDFPTDQKKWLGKLLSPLNQFMESVYQSLNQGLTLKDNMAATVLETQLEGQFPAKMSWTLKSKPVAVLLGQVERVDGTTVSLASAVGLRWSYNGQGTLQIDQITGITPSSTVKYRVTLVCFTG
jgi:hypothetical protein